MPALLCSSPAYRRGASWSVEAAERFAPPVPKVASTGRGGMNRWRWRWLPSARAPAQLRAHGCARVEPRAGARGGRSGRGARLAAPVTIGTKYAKATMPKLLCQSYYAKATMPKLLCQRAPPPTPTTYTHTHTHSLTHTHTRHTRRCDSDTSPHASMSVHKKYRHGTIDGPSSVGPLSLTARSHGPIIQPQVFLRVEVGGPRRSDVPELRPHLVSVSVRARARVRVRVRAVPAA